MSGIFQVVEIVGVIHMSVAVAFVAADLQGTFTEHSLNYIVILIMFQYCPSCGTKLCDTTRITFEGNRFQCSECGFVYYHNTAAASGCVIQVGGKILLLVRNREPSFGKLDLPGGFVDPGEGIFEGLYREIKEELGWEPPVPQGTALADLFTLFASFPNIYPYKNIVYNTCDLFFTISAPGLAEEDLHIEAEEISGVRFLRPEEIKSEDIAFDSTRRAIEAFRKFILKK